MHQLLAILLLVLFCGYAALLLYYAVAWMDLPDYIPVSLKPAPHETPVTVTVIIPARNEAARIGDCLDALLKQDYPKSLLQILVVDDFSEDETGALVKTYADSGVELIRLADAISEEHTVAAHKKKAIEWAISRTYSELIVTTDADCIAPARWISTLVAAYRETQAHFLVMPVVYTREMGAIGVFQSLDFMTLQGITAASVHRGIHSMCNGANLAYTRAAFGAVNGFAGIDGIASGDDMLLMHKIYLKFPEGIRYVKTPDVIVATPPAESVGAFFRQRIRWASKARFYEDYRITLVLAWVYIYNVLLVVTAVAAFMIPDLIAPLTAAVISKTCIEMLFLFPVARFYNRTALLWWFPLAQPFHILYTLIAGFLGNFGTYQWKGRRVQ